MIVLDTNVLSELVRPAPDPAVVEWLSKQRRRELCTTAVCEAELAYGLALLPPGRRRDALTAAVSRLLGEGLGGRVLAFDRPAATAYGTLAARRRAMGRPIAAADGQIAAIATVQGAVGIATRDRGGFEGCAVPIHDPWRP